MFISEEYHFVSSDVKIHLKDSHEVWGHKFVLSARSDEWGVEDLSQTSELDMSGRYDNKSMSSGCAVSMILKGPWILLSLLVPFKLGFHWDKILEFILWVKFCSELKVIWTVKTKHGLYKIIISLRRTVSTHCSSE